MNNKEQQKEHKSQARSTKNHADYNRRVRLVYQLLLKGSSRADVIDIALEKWGQLSTVSIDRYIHDANAMFDQIQLQYGEQALRRAVARLCLILDKTLDAKEHGVALETVRELNRIQNLHPNNKIKVAIEGEIKTTTDNELDKMLSKKVSKAGGITVLEVLRNAYRDADKKS